MADLRPQYTEEAVGANHPTKLDVINRAYNVEHDEDGTHGNITTTLNLTSGQIAFPATAVPSADPNTLDDYEEGSFGDSGANEILVSAIGSITCGTNYLCTYVKIGSLVSAGGFMQVSAIAGPNGNTHIILPIAVKAGIQHRCAGAVAQGGINYTADYLIVRAVEGTTTALIMQIVDNAAESVLDAVGIEVPDIVYFSVNYQV